MLKGKVPKYKIIGDFHINENRINDIWNNQEREQQMIYSCLSQIQSDISPEITSILVNDHLPDTGNSSQNIKNVSHLDSQLQDNKISPHSSTDTPDKQIKKRRSKSKSARVSDSSTISNTQIEQVLN